MEEIIELDLVEVFRVSNNGCHRIAICSSTDRAKDAAWKFSKILGESLVDDVVDNLMFIENNDSICYMFIPTSLNKVSFEAYIEDLKSNIGESV